MASQIHRRFTDDRVRLILDLYSNKVITVQQVLQQVGCRRSRVYQILTRYRNAPEEFTIAYSRNHPQHRLPEEVDRIIREE